MADNERELLAKIYADHFGEDLGILSELDYDLFDKILAEGFRKTPDTERCTPSEPGHTCRVCQRRPAASEQPAFREGDVVRNKHTGAVLTVRPPLTDWEPFYYKLVRPAESKQRGICGSCLVEGHVIACHGGLSCGAPSPAMSHDRRRVEPELIVEFTGQTDTPPSNPRGPSDEPCPTCDAYVDGCDHCCGVRPAASEDTIEQAARAIAEADDLNFSVPLVSFDDAQEWYQRHCRGLARTLAARGLLATNQARLEVDGEAGAWYVKILDAPVARTTEQQGPVHVDWTADGRMVGVEVLSALDGGDTPEAMAHCAKHIPGTSSNRCVRPRGHTGLCSDEVQVATGTWIITGETILDDPDEYRLDVFVRHAELPEIIAAYLAANNPTPGATNQAHGELAKVAKELRARAAQRDEIASDDGPECDGECETSDCHTVSAVATWVRAALLVERHIAVLTDTKEQHG